MLTPSFVCTKLGVVVHSGISIICATKNEQIFSVNTNVP